MNHHSRLSRGSAHWTRRLVIAAALVVGLALPNEARADRVHTLSRTLTHAKDSKTRISAAVSLGRLKDKRALKPLVHALKDKNRVVRAVAATALGHLGNDAALPALRRASKDRDRMVRKRATEAIASLRNDVASTRPVAPRARTKHTNKRRAGFGNAPRRLGPEPTLFVAVKSAADESKIRSTKKQREWREGKLRAYMLRELRRQSDVTMSEGEANSLGLKHNSVDLSITRLSRKTRGKFVEIECEIRITISNERGKMLSFLTGGAKVQVPKVGFRAKYLPQLRKEAIENAVKSVHGDLIRHLKRTQS